MQACVCVCVCLRDRGRKRDGLLSKTKTSHYIWLPQSWEGTEGILSRSEFVSFASLFFYQRESLYQLHSERKCQEIKY